MKCTKVNKSMDTRRHAVLKTINMFFESGGGGAAGGGVGQNRRKTENCRTSEMQLRHVDRVLLWCGPSLHQSPPLQTHLLSGCERLKNIFKRLGRKGRVRYIYVAIFYSCISASAIEDINKSKRVSPSNLVV